MRVVAVNSTLMDLKIDHLFKQIKAASDWTELIDDETPASIEEAEMLCLQRLEECINITRDHGLTIVYREDIDVGSTVREYTDTPPWFVTSADIVLNGAPDEGEAEVMLELEGTNTEEAPS